MKKFCPRGLTLIEILVVITIVSILAGFGFSNYQQQTKKARDGKRKADLEDIRSLLEYYRSDKGSYPQNLPDLALYGKVPSDPLAGRNYTYNKTSASTYNLCAILEIGGESSGSSGNCWGINGNCDSACNTSSIGSATVYTACNSGSCGSGCWGISGSCDAGCDKSSKSGSTVYTSCNSSSCTSLQWRKVSGGECTNRATNLRTYYSAQNCQNFKGENPTFECSSDGSGTCYSWDNGFTYDSYQSYYFRGSCINESSYTNICYSKIDCVWQTGSGFVYSVSGPTTKYTGSGTCNSEGSGNCYKLTNSASYYTGGSGCGGGGCSSNTYYGNYSSCSWKPSTQVVYSVSSPTTKYTGSGTCSSDGSSNCYKLTNSASYYTGGSSCGGSGCNSGTYYGNYFSCSYYTVGSPNCNYIVTNP